MYHTFIAPSERPPTSLEIKRALLTYERVVIPDPDDRDYFPPHLLIPAVVAAYGLPDIFGIDLGPVRPLGKIRNYDYDFDKLINEIDYARREGLIDVVSTYDREISKGSLYVGGTPNSGYPLDTTIMLWAYRIICREQNILCSAVKQDPLLLGASEEELDALAGNDCMADGKIANKYELPLLDSKIFENKNQVYYTKIARARIASAMKIIGYCASKELVPTFTNSHTHRIVSHMARRASQFVDRIAEVDPYLALRNRVLQLVHDEYVNDSVLETLTIDEVLKLRTRAWGKQAQKRDSLLQSAADLAEECKSASDFDRAVLSKIRSYRDSWDDVVSERRGLNFKVRCDLASTAGKVLGWGVAGEIGGMVTQAQSGIGAATLLIAGSIYSVERIKDYAPLVNIIKEKEAIFDDHACLGIHRFYNEF